MAEKALINMVYEKAVEHPFGEEILDDEYNELDDYEYDDLEQDILDDPVQLMKWLEKHNNE